MLDINWFAIGAFLTFITCFTISLIFFIHGSEDWLIKPHHSERLFKQAGQPKRIALIPGAGHAAGFYVAGAEYCRRVLGFFDGAFRGGAG